MYAAGSDVLKLVEPSYTVRFTFIVGGIYDELDSFSLDSTLPVEEHSWGMIKNLYKE